jgi:DNA repair protein RecO (recombination protein O)
VLSEKTLAIVLRLVEFSETSCVVTLYTREFGKVGALAKGARRPKSPFESALDLLALCRIVFLHKSSDALDLLTEAKLERRFRAARKDLSHLYAGYYVAELLDALTDEDDPHPDLFDAAERTLAALDNQAELAPLVLRFELTALRVLGHLPSLENCAGCGAPVATDGRVAFGQLAGGVLCSHCRVGQRQVVSVSGPVIDALRVFARSDETWQSADLAPRWRGELRGVMNQYLANLMGRRPKMHSYLGTLGANEATEQEN